MQQKYKNNQERNQIRLFPARILSTHMYKNSSYGYYYYSCNKFGHKAFDYKYYAKKSINALYVKRNSYVDNITRGHEPFPPFLGLTR